MWHIQRESYKVKSKLGIVGVFIIFLNTFSFFSFHDKCTHTRAHAHIERALFQRYRCTMELNTTVLLRGLKHFDNLALWKSLFFSDNALM